MAAYYNEHDIPTAAWLNELIKRGHIADGVVDTRSIEDVAPIELREFTQCHFFAGIGGWSLALRRAGWSDDRPVWTGSCPCQPFSAAGKGAGFADERHLWPAFYWLISECRPSVVFGEQVASKDGLEWLDLVQDDLEAARYAVGAFDLCTAGVKVADWADSKEHGWLQRAIHDCSDPVVAAKLRDFADWAGSGNLSIGGANIRQRLYWVANSDGKRSFSSTLGRLHSEEASRRTWDVEPERHSPADRVANSNDTRPQRHGRPVEVDGEAGRQSEKRHGSAYRTHDGMAYTDGADARSEREQSGLELRQQPQNCCVDDRLADLGPGTRTTTDPHRTERHGVDWLFSRDGAWRPVEPGTFPLAHGLPARMVRLRGYGNAINVDVAQTFVEAIDEAVNLI